MTPKQKEQFNRMRMALRTIAKGYKTPDQIRRTSERDSGLPYEEELEYAYENIQSIAARAVKGVSEIKS